MKKQIAIVGIFVLFILVVGLSGCDESSGIVSVDEVGKHSDRYMNTDVTVRGYYTTRAMGLWGWIYTISDDSGNSILAEIPEEVDDSILIQGREYHWTGKIVQEKNSIKLIVSNIQLV